MSELVPFQPSGSLAANAAETVVPALVADAGEHAARRFLEFFAATIRNKNTRVAYYNDARQFFTWCERRGIDGLERIEPIHVALYIEELQHSFSKPTVKQHLAAVRMLFDWLVTGQGHPRSVVVDFPKDLASDNYPAASKLKEFLELAKTASLSYQSGNLYEKRELVKSITSNLVVDRKNVVIKLRKPFEALANRSKSGGPYRYEPRTEARKILAILTECLIE
jgi:hypothetical protein